MIKWKGPQGEPFLPQHTSASHSIKESLKANTHKNKKAVKTGIHLKTKNK